MSALRRFAYYSLGVAISFFLVGQALALDVPQTFWGQVNGMYYTGNTAGNITTWTMGPAGATPYQVSNNAGATWTRPTASTSAAQFSAAPGGGVNAAQNIQLQARGATATITQTVKFPAPTIANLAKGIAKRTIPGIAVTVVAPYFLSKGIDYVNDQWVIQGPAPSGTATTYPATFGYYVDVWMPQNSTINDNGACHATLEGACSDSCLRPNTGSGPVRPVANFFNGSFNVCRDAGGATRPYIAWYHCGGGGTFSGSRSTGGTCTMSQACPSGQSYNSQGVCTPNGGGWGPASDAQIDTAADQISVDPNADVAIVQAMANAGSLPLPANTPATITTPGPVQTPSTTSQTQNPNGTTSTTNNYQTITFNKAGDTITNSNFTVNVQNVTQTTTCDDQQNCQTTTTTDDDTSDESYSDTALPSIPDLYERKYPNGLQGVWNDNKDQLMGSAFVQSLSDLIPQFGGGSCPNFGLTFNIASWANYGAQNFGVPCWVYDAIGLILLVTAAFTARAIIFGG